MSNAPDQTSETPLTLDEYNRVMRAIQRGITRYLNERDLPDFCSVMDFDTLNRPDETVSFEGDEYWNYGGHERHFTSIPACYLLGDEAGMQASLSAWHAEQEAQARKAQEAKRAEKQASLAHAEAQAARLRAELEGGQA
jgi:hypothetical protein